MTALFPIFDPLSPHVLSYFISPTRNEFRILVSKNILSKKKVDFGKPGMFFRILVSINILSKKKLTLENLECFSGF
jgi:hypothetical protein